MTNLNFSVLQGCIAKDAVLKKTEGGKTYAFFTLVVNSDRKSGEQWSEYASFFMLTLWGTRAEKIAPYLKKGAKVEVTGHLEQTRWDEDGDKKSRIDLRVEKVFFLSKPKADGTQSKEGAADASIPAEELDMAAHDSGYDASYGEESIAYDDDGLF